MTLKRGDLKRRNLVRLLLLCLILISVNVISSYFFSRLDLTSEKRYTLADASIKLVKELDDVVYIKVYLDGDLPSGFRRLRDAGRELLDDLRSYAGINLQYEFIDPSESSDMGTRRKVYQQLATQGILPTTLRENTNGKASERIIFPGAILYYKGRECAVNLLKNQVGVAPEEVLNASIEGLEYEVLNAIRKIKTATKQGVAFIEGHGELDEIHLAAASKALSEFYYTERVRIDGRLNCLNKYSAIIIAKPDSSFSEKDKFVIDQYIMRGGKVFWLVDGMDASMDSLQHSGFAIMVDNAIHLDDQLFKYGVRINPNLVADLQALPIPVVTGYMGNQPRQSLLPWYFFPMLGPGTRHPIVNNLNAVKSEFVSSMDTIQVHGVHKTILLCTSGMSRLFYSPARVDLGIMRNESDQRLFTQKSQATAVLLEGVFTSVFENRLTPEIAGSPDIRFITRSSPTKMVVVSDGDVIKNNVNKSGGPPYPLGYDRYTGQYFGNEDFIMNVMDYLCDDSGLMTVRSREVKIRLLDRLRAGEQRMIWQLVNTLCPVMLIIFFGLIKRYFRGRKYSMEN